MIKDSFKTRVVQIKSFMIGEGQHIKAEDIRKAVIASTDKYTIRFIVESRLTLPRLEIKHDCTMIIRVFFILQVVAGRV